MSTLVNNKQIENLLQHIYPNEVEYINLTQLLSMINSKLDIHFNSSNDDKISFFTKSNFIHLFFFHISCNIFPHFI
jgi:hypothetical protein